MQVLVIGATGFVGAALATRLTALGHKVTGLVRPDRMHTSAPVTAPAHLLARDPSATAPSFEARTGELGDPSSIAAAAEGAEVVFCCAGDHNARSSPAALAWLHVAGVENVISAARATGVRRIVLLSCAEATLTRGDRVHWKEDAAMSQAPFGAVARTKLLGEEVALQKSSRELAITALRPGFLWGAGERHSLPVLCAEGLSGGIRLLGSGQNLFSTTHVDLLVDALIAAMDAPKVAGVALHVADPETQTALEFFARLSQALGLPSPRRGVYAIAQLVASYRAALSLPGLWPTDVARRGRHCLLDCLRAATLLDLEPRVSFEDGMQALASWAQSVGGPQAIAKLTRPPLTDADTARFEQLAR
jgi:nucleoside-diphosphate-sugar epimerase